MYVDDKEMKLLQELINDHGGHYILIFGETGEDWVFDDHGGYGTQSKIFSKLAAQALAHENQP